MKILVVCHRAPYPPNRGGKIRPFHIIRHLSRSHHVTVASLARSTSEVEAAERLADYCEQVLLEPITTAAAVARMLVRLPTRTPSSMGYFWSPRLAHRLQRVLSEQTFHLVFVHCAFVAPYVSWLRGPAKLLDFGDIDSQKWLAYSRARRLPLTLGYALEAFKLRREEIRLARCFDLCTCTTPAELATLESYVPGLPAAWFPNGVDHEYFQPLPQPYDPRVVVFIGRLDYFPNQEGIRAFCTRVWPAVRAACPDAVLRIVGAAPARAIRALGHLPGVEVVADPPDIRPYLGTAAVSIAPLAIARGTQNKVLESLAMGVPAVITPAVASGIDAEPGHHFLTAAEPSEFALAVVGLLQNPEARHRLSLAGRARVISHHSWARAFRDLDRAIDRCLGLAAASLRFSSSFRLAASRAAHPAPTTSDPARHG